MENSKDAGGGSNVKVNRWRVVSGHRELYHYGIKGQKWGVRNGPPYPLNSSNRSASEKRAAQTKPSGSKWLDKKAGASYSTRQKQGLSVYGAYKSEYLDDLREVGQRAARSAINKVGAKPLSSFGDAKDIPSAPRPAAQSSPKPKPAPIIRDPKTGFKMIKESTTDSLKNANPLKGTREGGNNCTYSAVAGFLRTQGYDVTAKGTPGGKMQNLGGVLEDCFKGVKVYEGSATKFAKSPDDAAQMLKKRFGDNASGAVGIQFKGTAGGHTFSWDIKDGIVSFLDFQNQGDDTHTRGTLWRFMDPNGDLTFARLDGLELNLNAVDKYVNGR